MRFQCRLLFDGLEYKIILMVRSMLPLDESDVGDVDCESLKNLCISSSVRMHLHVLQS